MLFQLLTPLNKPKLWSFPNKNGMSRKIIGIEAAVAAKVGKLEGNCKIAKELQIREKYEVELAALNAEYSSFPLKTSSSS